jgi:hypothetical protein
MNEKRLRNPIVTGFLAVTLSLSQIGCGAQLIQVAIWIGQVVIYTAAVRATVKIVDQLIDQNQTEVGDSVEVDPSDPHRGSFRSMRVGKMSGGTPTGEMVTFENVPVVKNSSGKWMVEKYYCDTVMAPKLDSSN